jgi:hypothetical protein
MSISSEADFDFETWASLAKNDPQAFEAKRAEVIAALIAGASPRMQARLRGLQWRIDTERRLASNPLASCIHIFNQMWTSVYGKNGLLDALQGSGGRPLPESSPAAVVKLDRRRPDHKRHHRSCPSTHP